MRLIATGFAMMLGGLTVLFAMVIGTVEAGIFSCLAAYSLVVVGLLLSGFGLAAFVEGRR